MSSLETQNVDIAGSDDAQGRRLSYKFQRLRERIRSAIESGELAGKLPGERVLARRFKVNAKTLSKALTDLAAEGLLERNIGLGTFVRGASMSRPAHKVLILHDPEQARCPVIAALEETGEIEVQTHDDLDDLPPSLINPHRSIVICSNRIGDDVLRDLVVRGKTVITLERTSASYATHSVVIDRVGAVCALARQLMNSGHNDLMLVGASRPIQLHEEARAALPSSLSLRIGTLDEVSDVIAQGVTGFICTSVSVASALIETCRSAGVAIPQTVSVCAVGRLDDETPCSGNFVPVQKVAEAIRHLLQDATQHRPIGLWLSGEFVDRQTMTPVSAPSLTRPPVQYAWQA